MSNVEENSTANTVAVIDNVIPFGKKKPIKTTKSNKRPSKIDWKASSEEEAIYNRGLAAIDTHTDNMMGILITYMKECEVVNPSSMDLTQYRDLTLIKEAIKSTMFRVLGFEHDLHLFVDTMMIIPDPTAEIATETEDEH